MMLCVVRSPMSKTTKYIYQKPYPKKATPFWGAAFVDKGGGLGKKVLVQQFVKRYRYIVHSTNRWVAKRLNVWSTQDIRTTYFDD